MVTVVKPIGSTTVIIARVLITVTPTWRKSTGRVPGPTGLQRTRLVVEPVRQLPTGVGRQRLRTGVTRPRLQTGAVQQQGQIRVVLEHRQAIAAGRHPEPVLRLPIAVTVEIDLPTVVHVTRPTTGHPAIVARQAGATVPTVVRGVVCVVAAVAGARWRGMTMKLQVKRTPVVLAGLLLTILLSACSQPSQEIFDSPEAAIRTLSELIGEYDGQRTERVFGTGSLDMFRSGDEEADREDFGRVRAMIQEGVDFEVIDPDTRIALLGDDAWPWPIPLVRDGEGWRFDTGKGKDELLNRRVGHNELWTLTALHELVEMQREYRSESRDGNPPAYAQRFYSTEGMHDGLYWPTDEGSELSPAGEFLAVSEVREGEPRPFHGYFYRLLTRRGEHAPGGEVDYLDENGQLTRGFAAIAWPAKYGNSGVMTFVVSNHGLIFQKDFGPMTADLVGKIDSYNPDSSWAPTDDSMFNVAEEVEE